VAALPQCNRVPISIAIKALPVVVSVGSHGQRIQTGAFFRDDGTGGVCRVWSYSFYAHRAAHGRTPEERATYAIGLKMGEQAPPKAMLPTAADLNMMAQKYFKQQGSGNQQTWDQGFENRYTDGFNKTHLRQ
jgi:hypothetical protein